MKKGSVLILAALIMVFVSCSSYRTYAASDVSAPELYIDNYKVDNEEIRIFINQNQQDSSWITADDTRLMFGSKELARPDIDKFTDAPEIITYKCVVDVSGSMSQERIDMAKDMIKRIALSKRPDDNMTITAMGNDLIRSDYLTDAGEISELVSKIQRTGEDTNLYYGIVEEIKELQSNDMVGTKKCLIIFSDGADDQATGITQEEAYKAVEKSHIPIYTVAMPKNASSKNDQEMAKILGSFARLSSGGVHYYTPDYEKDELPLIGDRIVESINNSVIMTEDIRELDTTEKAHELKISVKTSEGLAEDTIDVAESDVKRIKEIQDDLIEESEEPTEKPTEETAVSENEVEEEPKQIFGLDPKLFYMVLAAIALLLVMVVLFVIIRLRSRIEDEDLEMPDDMGATSAVDDIGATGGISDLNGATLPLDGPMGATSAVDDIGATGGISDLNGATLPLGGSMGSETVGFDAPSSSGKAYHMTLTRMGKTDEENNVYKFDLTGRYSLGRSASKAQLAFPKDTALSGLHCTFYVQDKKIYLKDEHSTNGTFVNGVPITGSYAIEKDDTLIIGSNEYRVTWK